MHEHGGGISLMELIGFGLLMAIAVYVVAAYRTGARGHWPAHRIILWIGGCLVTALSLQVATSRHDDFVAHTVAHVGLGMLAPLLLVLAGPVTLALRSLDVVPARRLARLLKSWPFRFVGHPVTAGVLTLGGLWLLYVGGLYGSLHNNGLLFAVVHLHVFVSGYLFTAAIIGIDPNLHRAGWVLRAAALCAVMAGHSIISTYLAGHPPAGVSPSQAEAGSMVMYYGGGVVAVALAVVFCGAWYREAGHRRASGRQLALSPSRASSDGRSTSSSSRSRSWRSRM
jgi:putative membrane protein